MEIWKDIKGYEGIYEISNKGQIKSLERTIVNSLGRKYIIKQKIRILSFDKDNYYIVSLWKNNKQKTYRVHRLVAQAFIPNPENKPEINHKDGDKTNNYVDNLEWNTNQENHNHAIKNKLHVYGESHPNCKLNKKLIKDICNDIRTNLIISKKYKISPSYVSRIKLKKVWIR